MLDVQSGIALGFLGIILTIGGFFIAFLIINHNHNERIRKEKKKKEPKVHNYFEKSDEYFT